MSDTREMPTPSAQNTASHLQGSEGHIDPEILLARLEEQDTAEQIEALESLLSQLTSDLSTAQE